MRQKHSQGTTQSPYKQTKQRVGAKTQFQTSGLKV